MKGDLSRYSFRAEANFTGTLFQQGRAFSDQDGNAADAIGRHLRQVLGRDVIGPGVAAVPQEEGDSLKILEAASRRKSMVWPPCAPLSAIVMCSLPVTLVSRSHLPRTPSHQQ